MLLGRDTNGENNFISLVRILAAFQPTLVFGLGEIGQKILLIQQSWMTNEDGAEDPGRSDDPDRLL